MRCWARCCRVTTPTHFPGTAAASSAAGQSTPPTARMVLERLPAPVLSSLRWPGRPELPGGYMALGPIMVQYHPFGEFALFVGELSPDAATGPVRPFEVWVNGTERAARPGRHGQDTCLWTCAPTTRPGCSLQAWTYSGHTDRRARVRHALPAPSGEMRRFPGVVAATAAVIRWRCEQLKACGPWGQAKTVPPRRCWTRCSAGKSRARALRARWAGRWTSTTLPRARAFTLTLKEVTLPTR
jgi:ribonucleoside-diphosphate reductase alpha chain